MDLNDVRIFVGVVQTGSLSGAAARLEMPLPTVSRRIRALEKQLRVQLLERTARGTRLTEAGTRLYEHASRGVEILAEGEQAVVSDQARLKGRLRLSLPPAFEAWWELLSAFQKRYPDIRVHAYATERRVDLIEDGIDVALRVGAIAHEAMVARALLAYRHVLVASPSLVDALGIPEVPDDLHRFPCAIWSSAANFSRGWRLGDRTFEPDAALSTNDYMHLRSRAIAGEVVTELPPFLAAEPIQQGRLTALLCAYPLPEQHVNLLYPSHRHPSAIVRAYLEFCQSQVAWLEHVCAIR
ncbi:LysR family transcriptional regulator [Burkholderia thailandensis]|uniref:LysR substrate binding domain protein n=1 Tax=Burkholderia thailandensis TaxID=57975 RepID=A0AAW9CWN2_BURTH|nr:LysR family transcriptional regulator [Burkholderia thailandensis]AHI66633.1 bacterial regulatory helix-turn-helix, lysR family protein [Burkholderia thailandensis H0587]AIP65371.1 LysR family transcriptional regulator [Burkholderia thailandensis]AOI55655.1 LysR family transcriptional regulator [Burkholderia thailandensis]AOJ54620.1 LysR family transcriptional regulator [Burkholderia thailandensis]AVR27212.1 LysR family transcriptional regulator [Burkholderia thailandensis]